MKKNLFILLLAFALAGCFGRAPTFYLLSAEGEAPSGGGVGIGVGPVSLAEYVDRENLVIQTGPNEIQIAESHLWAGDLDASVKRVLAVNLGRRLNTGNVQTYPWLRESELDYQVVVDIRQFVAGDDGYAFVEAAWRVYSLPGSQLVVSDTFSGKEPIAAEDYASVVAAESKLLGRLSAEIAGKIKSN
ncbi:membrane integrity-associated transporter subunit PqiC [Luteolibacter sp. AS25]|uniref:PqiC family protein n=1 Tax=Luteolibacter sp. AS25 TaxID=3135776 RepID=UPI00398B0C88